jgi:hypothetical protein
VAALLPWFQNTTEIWQFLGDCAGRHLGGIIRRRSTVYAAQAVAQTICSCVV